MKIANRQPPNARHLTLAVSLALACTMLGTASCNAQAPVAAQPITSPDDPLWQFQHDLFQMLLEEQGLKVQGSLQDVFSSPMNSVLVVVGKMRAVDPEQSDLFADYVLGGGRLLIATDQAAYFRGIGHVQGSKITAMHSNDRYMGYPDCLSRSPAKGIDALASVNKIVTNRCTWLTPNASLFRWTTWLQAPELCEPNKASGRPILLSGRPTSREVAGRIIIAGDGSLFSNGMLWHGSNASLATVVSKELCSGGGRMRLAFISDGLPLASIATRANNGIPPAPPMEGELPEPTWQRALRLANAVVSEVQESNIANETLKQRPRHLPARKYFQNLIYYSPILLVLALIWIAIRSGVFKSVFLQPRRMLAAFQLRDSTDGGKADYRSAAGLLAREFCFELTGSQQSRDWQNYWVRIEGDKKTFHDPGDRKRLSVVIDVAGRGFARTLSRSEFEDFGSLLQGLRSRLRSNKT
ncbi:MAG: DUF4350 domain-containing protein [Pirellulaceae bacterium]